MAIGLVALMIIRNIATIVAGTRWVCRGTRDPDSPVRSRSRYSDTSRTGSEMAQGQRRWSESGSEH